MRYVIHVGSSSPHDVAVALGLESADHATGVLCTKLTLSTDPNGTTVYFDGATLFEIGQPLGELSPAKVQALAAGLWHADADMTGLRAYLALAPGTATPAQTQAALQTLLRALGRLIARL